MAYWKYPTPSTHTSIHTHLKDKETDAWLPKQKEKYWNLDCFPTFQTLVFHLYYAIGSFYNLNKLSQSEWK